MLLETSFGFQMWTLVQEGLDLYQSDVVNRAEYEETFLWALWLVDWRLAC